MQRTLRTASGIARRHGDRNLLGGIDVNLSERARVGLVGPNGCGKSTLLRILAGLEPPDEGIVRQNSSVGYLPQVNANTDLAAQELIAERIGVGPAGREVDALARRLESGGDLALIEAHGEALERWMALGGSDAEARIATAADELGLSRRLLGRPVAELSGDEAARVGLASLLAARFDLVLLDEPSNHLDTDGLDRLGELIESRSGGVLVASHDRELLARHAEEVLAIDPDHGSAQLYGGGWDAFVRERETAEEHAHREYEQAVGERARVLAAAAEQRRRAAASASRVASRGGAKDGDKHGREWVRMRADGARRRAARVEHRAEMVEVPDKPVERPRLGLELTTAERRAGWTVALERAVVARGEFRLGPVDLTIEHGDRVLLSGPNGSGKSTLLELILGELEPASGARRAAASTVVARLGQDRELLAGESSATEALAAATGLTETEARTALASFGLRGGSALRQGRSLSPGERTRAELAAVAHRRATCLLLDEPSNHLDIESLEVLEGALADWPGALVVASHDRRFTRELAPWRELSVRDGVVEEAGRGLVAMKPPG